MKWFVAGVIAMALLLGFLVGGSSSPVAGVAVTAGFGLLASALAFVQASAIGDPGTLPATKGDKKAAARRLSVDTLNSLGRLLVAFVVAFAVGLAAGWAIRMKAIPSPAPLLPWQGGKVPVDIRVALDWIIVARHLGDLGYEPEQIQALYRLSDDGRAPSNLNTVAAPNGDLLSPLFGYAPKASAPGGPPIIADRPPKKVHQGVDG